MNNIEGGFRVPERFVGAYQCSATDIYSKPNRILVITPLSTIQTALYSAQIIKEDCSNTFPGKCKSECPISMKIEELSNLLLIETSVNPIGK